LTKEIFCSGWIDTGDRALLIGSDGDALSILQHNVDVAAAAAGQGLERELFIYFFYFKIKFIYFFTVICIVRKKLASGNRRRLAQSTTSGSVDRR